MVAAAVTAVGAQRRQNEVAGGTAGRSNRFWGDSDWTEQKGLPVCLGHHSPRHLEVPADRLALLAEAFGG